MTRHRSISPRAPLAAVAAVVAVLVAQPAPARAQDVAPPGTTSPAPPAAVPEAPPPPAAGSQLPPAPPALGSPAPYPYPYPYPYAWAPPQQLLPARLDYVDGGEIPPGYHVETGIRTGLVIAGAVMLGVGYGIAAGAAASTDVGRNGSDGNVLYIPVVGPFMLAGSFDYGGQLGGLAFMFVGMPLILNGLVQTAGSILLVAGLGSSRSWLQRNDIAVQDTTPHLRVGLPSVGKAEREADAAATLLAPSSLAPAPVAASGLSMVGRF